MRMADKPHNIILDAFGGVPTQPMTAIKTCKMNHYK